jgi:hypothetical protein
MAMATPISSLRFIWRNLRRLKLRKPDPLCHMLIAFKRGIRFRDAKLNEVRKAKGGRTGANQRRAASSQSEPAANPTLSHLMPDMSPSKAARRL